jgi:hypothetical protein
MISTTGNQIVSNKKDNYKKLREFHEKTFQELGCPDAFFLSKLAYKEKSIGAPDEKIVALFSSEVTKGDVFIEFADSENIPQDPERRLYKWRHNPNYNDEYVSVKNGDTVRYLIPVSELILIQNNPAEQVAKEQAIEPAITLSSVEDLPLKEATIRDLAAIMWRRPISNKTWINDLINK